MDFYGIYTPVITPYHDDFSIDEPAFDAMLEKLIADGVHGIIIAGTTGEYYAQTLEERVHLLKRGCDVIGGRLPVIGGTGAMRTEDAVFLATAAKDAGVDGILIATPPYSVPTGRENALHAIKVERTAGLPVMLYNYPGRMAAEMDEDFLDRVGQSPNFRAIKKAPVISIACICWPAGIRILPFPAAWMIRHLSFLPGARSWVCAASNFAAGAHIALWQACVVDGNFSKGRRIMTAMLPLMQELEQGGKFIQSIKHGVELSGHVAGVPRLPLKPLNKDEKRALEQVITTMNNTIAAIEKEA